MKSKLQCAFLLLFAVFATLLPRSGKADSEISFDYFYDSLAPYGDWVQVSDYGYCWHPTGVSEDWTPYSDGYWTYTDAGWTWVSYEDFGGVVYHYGRWMNLEDEGWVWVPGNDWGPAWVSWRSSDDYVGWAPLPPEAHFQADVGFSVWVDTSYDIGPSSYRFCHVHDFGAPIIGRVCLPRHDNVTIIQRTVNITNITYNRVNNVVFNGGPNYVTINRRVNRPIPALKLVRNTQINVAAVNGRRHPIPTGIQRGNQLEVFTPKIVNQSNATNEVRPQNAKSITTPKIDRGWAGMNNPEAREAIKTKYRQETKGLNPDTAPARPIAAKDLTVIPKKADPTAHVPGGALPPGLAKGKQKGAAEPRPQPAPAASAPAQTETTDQPKEDAGLIALPKPAGPLPPKANRHQPEQKGKPGSAPAVANQPAPVAPDTANTGQPANAANPAKGPAGRKGNNPALKSFRGDNAEIPNQPNKKVATQPAPDAAPAPAGQKDSTLELQRRQNIAREKALQQKEQNEAAAARQQELKAQKAEQLRESQKAQRQAAAERKAQQAEQAQVESAKARREQQVEAQKAAQQQQAIESRRASQQQQAAEAKRAAQQQQAIEARRAAQQQQAVAAQRAAQQRALQAQRAAQQQRAIEAQRAAQQRAQQQVPQVVPPQGQPQPQPQPGQVPPGKGKKRLPYQQQQQEQEN